MNDITTFYFGNLEGNIVAIILDKESSQAVEVCITISRELYNITGQVQLN